MRNGWRGNRNAWQREKVTVTALSKLLELAQGAIITTEAAAAALR